MISVSLGLLNLLSIEEPNLGAEDAEFASDLLLHEIKAHGQ